jgi:hypothetical protein
MFFTTVTIDRLSVARLKHQFCGHRDRVLLQKMTVGSHQQRTAVFVAMPSSNRGNVNASLNGASSEEVPQIVMSDMGKVQRRAST